jgi:hypothetical protein
MSAGKAPLDPADAPAPAAKRFDGKTVIIAMVVLAALAYRTWFSGSKPDNAPVTSESASTTPDKGVNAATKESAEIQESMDLQSMEAIGDLEITGPTNKGALLKLKNNLDLTTSRMNQVIENQNTLQQRQELFEKKLIARLDTKMGEITQILTQLSSDRAFRTAREGVSLDTELMLPVGEGQSLGDDGTTSLTQSGKKKTFTYESYTIAPANGQTSETVGSLQSILGGNANKTAPTNKNQTKDDKPNTLKDLVSRTEKVVSKYEVLEIGKGSFARAKLLHGIDCPVGGTGVVTDLFNHVPVTAVLTGKFVGPNGSAVNIGHAEFQGVCVGQRTTERARIKIESLSYVDEEGKQQNISVNGYINDGTDNSIDVPGYLISTRTDDLIKTASFAGLSTMASALSGAQITQTASAATGTSTSSVTGDVGTSVAASGLAAVLERVATLTAAELEASVDIIRVPAGRGIIFYSLDPIKVDVLKDNYEESGNDLS